VKQGSLCTRSSINFCWAEWINPAFNRIKNHCQVPIPEHLYTQTKIQTVHVYTSPVAIQAVGLGFSRPGQISS